MAECLLKQLVVILGDKVDAIINISGMQALGMSCIPKKPVSMVIYGAKNDFTVPPVDILHLMDIFMNQ